MSTPSTHREDPIYVLECNIVSMESFDKGDLPCIYYYFLSTVNGLELITSASWTIHQSPLFSFPLGLPCNSSISFAHMIPPDSLGSCIKIRLKCTQLLNIFSPCLQIYQSAYNILCISALFIVAEYHWLFSKDISFPICYLHVKFFCQRLYIFTLSVN